MTKLISAEPDALLEVKKKAIKTLATRLESFRLEQDIAIEAPDHKAWLLEVRGKSGQRPVRQIHFFAGKDQKILYLTYESSEVLWHKYKKPFRASAESLKLLE
jgi:hypothetical protein